MDNFDSHKSFGLWKLSEETKNVLEFEESKCDVNIDCDFRYFMLIADFNKNQVQQCPLKSSELILLDGLSDFSFPVESAGDKSVTYLETCSGDESGNNDWLSSKLINYVKQDFPSYELSSILFSTNSEKLKTCTIEAWKELKSIEEKQKFIKLLSDYNAGVICTHLLFPELINEDTFYPVMDILLPVIGCLDNYAIDNLFIPLLSIEDSFLICKTSWSKDFAASLSDSQKSHLMKCFLDLLERCFKRSYLQFLPELLEAIQLNDASISRLVILFDSIIEEYNNDRLLGKILLAMVDNYASTSKLITKELVQLCSKFKGIMKFKINASLKKYG